MPRSWPPVTLAMLGVVLPPDGVPVDALVEELGGELAEVSGDSALQWVVASNATAPRIKNACFTVDLLVPGVPDLAETWSIAGRQRAGNPVKYPFAAESGPSRRRADLQPCAAAATGLH